jgi:hypothetical protein
MLSELLKNKNLFCHLYTIDKNVAEQYRQMPCPLCGGPLHFANYLRKPRGEPDGVPEECFIRFSLCCGTEGCRHRVMPPSCRFMGRKVYWHVVILIILSDWQHKAATNIFNLSKLFDVSRNTVTRWIAFFHDIFPSSPQWQRIRGQVAASIKNNKLPSSLVSHFLNLKSCAKNALVSCLKFLSRGSEFCQKTRAG